MHKKGICHRDLTPDNILVDIRQDRIEVKIIDFGVAQRFRLNNRSGGMLTNTGMPAYKAPEMVEGNEYTEKVDLWMLGVVMYECLSGVNPFWDTNLKRTMENIL